MSIPESISLAQASGMTVRVAISGGTYDGQSVVVSGAVLEQDAIDAVLRQLDVDDFNSLETEVL